jgi:hypothetical protein
MTKLLLFLLSLFDLLAIIEELIPWIELILLSNSWLMRLAALTTLVLLCSKQLSLILEHWVQFSPRFSIVDPCIIIRFWTVPLSLGLLMMGLEGVTHKFLELIVLFLGCFDHLSPSADLFPLHPLDR